MQKLLGLALKLHCDVLVWGTAECEIVIRGTDSKPKNREAAGYDFEANGPDGRALIRCEPGDRSVEIGVGRELVSCLAETGADRAVVVTAAGSSEALASFLSGRPLKLVDPIHLSL